MKNIEFHLKNSMGTLVGRTSHAILNQLQKRFRQEGFTITVEQWQILVNLNNTNGQFHQQLAANTFKEKSTISRILDNLEKKGFVVRIPDDADRRQKRIRITGEGKKLLKKLRPYALDVQKQALNRVDLEQMKVCQEILLMIYENVTSGGSEL